MLYKDMMKYRNFWVGIAMVWIVIFHIDAAVDSFVVDAFISLGYAGVDICLFASGAGCYCSLRRDPDPARFFLRRVRRLGPVYLCFILPWMLFRAEEMNFPALMGNLLGVETFTGQGPLFNWYIGALLLFYLLAPFFAAAADRMTRGQKWAFLLLLVSLSFPFWRVDGAIILVSRIPIFWIGMLFGKSAMEEKKLDRRQSTYFAAALLIGMAFIGAAYVLFPQEEIWSLGLYWYPFILITPGLCIGLSVAAAWVERLNPARTLMAGVKWVGNYSFELYLIHIPMLYVIKDLLAGNPDWPRLPVWLAGLTAIAAACVALRYFSGLVVKVLRAVRCRCGG